MDLLSLRGNITNLFDRDIRMVFCCSVGANDPNYGILRSDDGSLPLPDSTETRQSFQTIGSLNSVFAIGAPPSGWEINEEDIENCQAYKLPPVNKDDPVFDPMTFYLATRDFFAYALRERWPDAGRILLLEQPICHGHNEMTDREFCYYDHFVVSSTIPVPEKYQHLLKR